MNARYISINYWVTKFIYSVELYFAQKTASFVYLYKRQCGISGWHHHYLSPCNAICFLVIYFRFTCRKSGFRHFRVNEISIICPTFFSQFFRKSVYFFTVSQLFYDGVECWSWSSFGTGKEFLISARCQHFLSNMVREFSVGSKAMRDYWDSNCRIQL